MNKALPQGWKMLKFEDIGIHISEKIAPGKTELGRYVGLEHLDSESLRIKRWGAPSDVIGEKTRVRPGEVIFGKRRAYQRKLAIAEFDCICSAHAMVLKANENAVRKDFFPFFLQSELFMEQALRISVGSLSPTINWGTLKKQEFPVPPLAEQKRIAEILWAVENSIRKTEDAIEVAERYKRTLMKHLFMYGPVSVKKSKQMKIKQTKMGKIPESWIVHKVRELAEVVLGGTPSTQNSMYWNDEVPWMVSGDVHKNIITEVSGRISKLGLEESSATMVNPPAVAIALAGQGKTRGTAALTMIPLCTNQSVALIKPNESILIASYLYYNLTHRYKELRSMSTGSSGRGGLNKRIIESIHIAVPPICEQEEISSILSSIDNRIALGHQQQVDLKQLKNGLMQVLLTGKLRVAV